MTSRFSLEHAAGEAAPTTVRAAILPYLFTDSVSDLSATLPGPRTDGQD